MSSTTLNDESIFKSKIYLLPNSLGKGRLSIFKDAFSKFRLNSAEDFDCQKVKFVIVEESLDLPTVLKILKLDVRNDTDNSNSENNRPVLISTKWLTDSIKSKYLLPTADYTLKYTVKKPQTTSTTTTAAEIEAKSQSLAQSDTTQSKIPDVTNKPSETSSHLAAPKSIKRTLSSDEPLGSAAQIKRRAYSSESDGSDDEIMLVKNPVKKGALPKGNWQCAQSSLNPVKTNQNKEITDKLEEMANLYEKAADKWRAYSYQKAVAMLKRHPKRVTTFEEIVALPGIGQRLADKIWEIIETGGFLKLEEYQSRDDITALNIFGNIWGAGVVIAKQWVDQGFRTLDDIRTKAKLTPNQQVGLKYYDEFLERIPRDEVAQIESIVKDAVELLCPGSIVQTCGSYRRGKPTCGDIDILITHPDGLSHEGLLHPVIDNLKKSGFLTDDLSYSDKHDEESGAHMKYFGVCILPGENQKHRRIDIIIIPYSSAYFNRSMRKLAHGMNMYLSQHRLNTGVIRKGGVKINNGTTLPTPTEESIFKFLNLEYRPPVERDH
ncbi:unnamed protein product [Didymodactylos carnosus]|uniref:DNA polymerase n=1 Tax=Didymodactylos carnosus TaxID=1234261 RepID=A0A8S2H154_9BILA|nr:unnamed protein product [Didymodactylos carnosus]CAF3586681.1 unnamed protein product [Didymodactylos carnosus]